MAFCGIAELELIIEIDTSKTEKVEQEVVLSNLYYQPNGFFQTPKKMKDACEKADKQLDKILHPIYYSTFPGPRALWERLPKGSASLERVRNWVNSQLIGELHCRPPRIVYAHFTKQRPDYLHQADIMEMPNDHGRRYSLCVIDCASRYKDGRALTRKLSSKVAMAFEDIYNDPNSFLNWPVTLKVGQDTEMKGEVTILFESHGTQIEHTELGHYVSLAFVNSLHSRLRPRLFKGMQRKELIAKRINKDWVKSFRLTIMAINNEKTRHINMKPIDAHLLKKVPLKFQSVPPENDLLPLGIMKKSN
ncbi:2911_t:CDS:2 [Acaulospora morrowiae]|uniref:2911_t:CDS:1 n=1 Tax=Acaulospora morrowiae TaxID=94023 RepID=A0A9N8VTL8_9GLOM|nr:2911_t:CDS:2 [Acaulospora morrowiae]